MNRAFVTLFVLLAMLFPCLALGAAAPVVVTHTLTGYHKSADAVTLDYALHVVNRGKEPLSDLTLALVPSPLFRLDRITVTVGTLGPHESADVPVQMVSPVMRDEARYSRSPLQWNGKYLDAQGNTLRFPATSRAGGAK